MKHLLHRIKNLKWLMHGLALMVALPALAQEGPPAKIIVGFPAGGSFDAIARLLADKAKTELNRPVVVENKAGAGGRIAVDALKAAPADGSVVMLGPDALTALYPFTFKKLNYDPVKDFAPITLLTISGIALAVNNSVPATNLKEFIEYAKTNKVNFGSWALGSSAHAFAQAEALMRGRSEETVRAEMAAAGASAADIDLIAPHRVCPGERPSAMILFRRLDAYSLGRLIALYEHKVAVQGCLWGIDSYDQWGVELGKQIAGSILPALTVAYGVSPASMAVAVNASTLGMAVGALGVAGSSLITMSLNCTTAFAPPWICRPRMPVRAIPSSASV